jgi:DNA-binding response OmpR family regulator
MLHVCLAGPLITSNEALVGALRAHHEVSLMAHRVRLEDSRAVHASDVLVLDATGIRATLCNLIRALRLRRPDLPIVLVEGSLSEDDKAEAFSLGVYDYFPAPCHVDLLAERLLALARARVVTPPS